MNRRGDEALVRSVIKKLRQIDGMAIRSTAIVGFPTETDEEFEQTSSLSGLFNVYNCLGCMVVARLFGISSQTIKEGVEKIDGIEGRNQTLYNHILTLQSLGLSKSEIRVILQIANEYVFEEPLPASELDTISRDEAFRQDSFYEG